MVADIYYDVKIFSASMADKSTVLLLISIVANTQWPIEHMDMKSAYIHTLFKYIQSVYTYIYSIRRERMEPTYMGRRLENFL